MTGINKHILVLTLGDVLRFGLMTVYLLPILAGDMTISGDSPTNYRILLWLASPQLLLTVYLGAVSIGLISDQGLKPLSFIAKILSAAPAALSVASALLANRQRDGVLVADGSELNSYILMTAVVLMDLVFCIILLMYKTGDDRRSEPGQI